MPLFEILKETTELRAGRDPADTGQPAKPKVAPPPNMGDLAGLADWNEMKR